MKIFVNRLAQQQKNIFALPLISRFCLFFVFTAIHCFIIACSPVSVQVVQELGTPSFSPTDPGSVEILNSQPSKPSISLGEIKAEPTQSATNADIETQLRIAAGKLGANAVVIVSDRDRLMGAAIEGGFGDRRLSPEFERVIIAVAIRYS
jgi:hypothetical protein